MLVVRSVVGLGYSLTASVSDTASVVQASLGILHALRVVTHSWVWLEGFITRVKWLWDMALGNWLGRSQCPNS